MTPRHSSDAFLGNDAGSAGSTGFGDAPADAGGFGGGGFGDGGFGASPAGRASSPDSAGPGSAVQFGDGDSDIVQQARGRSGDFLFGDDRAIGSPPNWEARDSTQLYQGATMANDPGTAESVGQSWVHHGKELETAANDLYNAISELGAAWVGQGAAAAQGTLIGIANSSSQAAQAAHSMGSRMAQQAAAAAEVKKMPAPKEFDPAQQMSAMLAGGPAAMVADMKAQSDAAKEVKAQQVQYFDAYTKSMSEVDNSTPSFGPQSVGLKPMATTGAGGVDPVGMTGGPPAGPAGAPAGAGAPAAGAAVAGGAGDAGSGVPAQSEFAQAGFVSGEGAAPAPNAGPSPEASGAAAPGPAAAPAAAGSSGPSNVAQSLGTAAVGGGLGFAGARALSSGSRSGSSKQQSNDTETAADPKSVGNSATANVPQSQGVVPPSGTIGGGGANAAAGHGGAPMGPMAGGMGAGGAGSQQEQDHSHASFLIEPDPDDAFGATEATPPPVIGAWSDDEER